MIGADIIADYRWDTCTGQPVVPRDLTFVACLAIEKAERTNGFHESPVLFALVSSIMAANNFPGVATMMVYKTRKLRGMILIQC